MPLDDILDKIIQRFFVKTGSVKKLGVYVNIGGLFVPMSTP
jgi:hypothetical protein